MEHSDKLGGNEFPTPEVMARKIRSSYKMYFGAPIVCIMAAILFAVGHEWMVSASFAVSALIYFPASLSQYRSSKKICEGIIQRYQQWHQENSANSQ